MNVFRAVVNQIEIRGVKSRGARRGKAHRGAREREKITIAAVSGRVDIIGNLNVPQGVKDYLGQGIRQRIIKIHIK